MNPHKWMGVGFDFSAYYVRDPQHLIRVMSTNPSYLRTVHDGEVKNFRDWHIPLDRRFRALKRWFVPIEQGAEGIQARLRRDTVCICQKPAGLHEEAALAAHNLHIARRIAESGKAYLTRSVLKGKQLLRISIGSGQTERKHVVALRQELQRAALTAR